MDGLYLIQIALVFQLGSMVAKLNNSEFEINLS